jgi:hypothetical protein
MFRQKSDRGKTTQIVGGLTLSGIVNALYPVNSLLLTTDNVNPGTRFTGTTWIAYGGGRALVAVGNNGENTYTGGQTFGADAVTLTAAQSGVNAHTHANDPVGVGNGWTGPVSANHTHSLNSIQKTNTGTYTGGDNDGSSVSQGNITGRFTASVSGTTNGVSANHYHQVGAVNQPASATAHENRQKSVAVYVWLRTA